MEYKALGNENFIIVGNFFDNDLTHAYEIQFRDIAQPMLANSAYYFIDEVHIEPKYSATGLDLTALTPAFEIEKTDLNKNYVLKNIQFELDSYRLLTYSFDELGKVAAYLARNPKARVQLSGHTDDQGKNDYNIKLSKNRALSAAGYLISLGISKDRIETFGYGESKPLIPEITDQARRINRRVEVRFIQ
jgi:OOP family OmpA-OmpF porin